MTPYEQAQEYLSTAPIPGHVDDFSRVVAEVARRLFSRFSALDTWQLMLRHWLPRFDNRNDDDGELFTAITVAHEQYDKELAERLTKSARREEAVRQKRWREERAAREAAREAEQETRAQKIAKTLNCGLRHAYTISNEGTTRLDHAKKLAAAFETTPGEWLREPGRRGRRVRVVPLLNRLFLPGCTVRDFLAASPAPTLDGDANALAEALSEAYTSRRVTEEHFPTFDAFRQHARFLGFSIEAAERLWDQYQPWRLDKVFEQAQVELWD